MQRPQGGRRTLHCPKKLARLYLLADMGGCTHIIVHRLPPTARDKKPECNDGVPDRTQFKSTGDATKRRCAGDRAHCSEGIARHEAQLAPRLRDRVV
jgi:hypothetical protein